MCLTRQCALPAELSCKYEVVKVLGVGSYAVVYQVRQKKTRKDFALKVLEKEPMRIRNMIPQVKREIAIAQEQSGTPHITQQLEVTETPTHFFMRFELCKANLEEMCKRDGPMAEGDALQWLKQACLGVQELHSSGIIHRDLKPSNFLVDAEGTLSICDFGFACRTTDGLDGVAGSPNYAPPEACAAGSKHTTKIDIYCLGACLQHFLLGRIPDGAEDMPEGLSAETQELLDLMMSPKPKDRPSIDELLAMIKGDSIFTQWVQGWHIMFQNISGA